MLVGQLVFTAFHAWTDYIDDFHRTIASSSCQHAEHRRRWRERRRDDSNPLKVIVQMNIVAGVSRSRILIFPFLCISFLRDTVVSHLSIRSTKILPS